MLGCPIPRLVTPASLHDLAPARRSTLWPAQPALRGLTSPPTSVSANADAKSGHRPVARQTHHALPLRVSGPSHSHEPGYSAGTLGVARESITNVSRRLRTNVEPTTCCVGSDVLSVPSSVLAYSPRVAQIRVALQVHDISRQSPSGRPQPSSRE